jgi:signal transduction histidine kinase
VHGGFEALIRAHDWSSTALGPMERWPAHLRTVAGICVQAPQPMLLAWGESLCVLFNEAWRSQNGAHALGQPLAAHAPAKVGAFRTVWVSGQALDHEGNTLIPITDERGAVSGVLMMPHAQVGVAKAIGHELRNPLATVLTAAQLIERRAGTDDRLGDPARRIVDSVERMSGMLDQLVGYMRLQAGGLALKCAPVDVATLVRDAVDSVRAKVLQAQLQWRVSFEAVGDAAAQVDAERLRQVVMNLAGNAAAHAPMALCRVRVDAVNATYIALTLENAGALPAEVKPFEAFAGFGPARGVGLGLYMARALVEAHGGTVTAHSKAGVTRVTVLLPRTPPAVSAA